MSTSRLFLVALALVAAAAVLPMFASQTLSLESRLEASQSPAGSMTPPEGKELRNQIASLRGMHERLIAAVSEDERRALFAESQRVMSGGIALMRRMKPTLPVSESGEVNSRFVTEAESDAIKDFLALMELLVQLKRDQDVIITPSGRPAEPVQPGRIQSAVPSPTPVRAFS